MLFQASENEPYVPRGSRLGLRGRSKWKESEVGQSLGYEVDVTE